MSTNGILSYLENTNKCAIFHMGGRLEIGKITDEVDNHSPHAFVPTLKPRNSEGDAQDGGYVSRSRAANLVTLLWLRGEFRM